MHPRSRFLAASAVVFLVLSLGPGTVLMAGETVRENPHILIAADYDAFTRIGPPARMLDKNVTKTATFNVTYIGFPPAAQAAFQAAVDIWSALITSTVPIKIEAEWASLDPGVLGGTGSNFHRDQPGFPLANTWYVDSLGDALGGVDMLPSDADIFMIFSNGSNGINWYTGTDGNPSPGQFDLVTVALHEIGHGLGMTGSMQVVGSTGLWGFLGFPTIYDRFTENASGTPLLNTSSFPNPSIALGSALTGGNVYFDGPLVDAANGGSPPPLYAPSPWQGGSSYSHFDENDYPPGNPGSLMTPFLASSEVIHDPGDLFLCLLEDLGWQTAANCGTAACVPSATNLCLNGGRFKVEVEWTDFQGNTGDGQVVPGVSSDDSGLFYFFNPDNWEMLIKVLDNCSGFTNHFWVFAAATTNVEYTLTVTDTQAHVEQVYFNPLGTAAPAITDTSAFFTCP